MSTRTRRKERGETKTKTQRRQERWEAKLAAAGDPADRFAVHQDWFRSSVQLMLHRHTRPDPALGLVPVTDPRAIAQADQLHEYAGDLLAQLRIALDGGEYDQPGR